MEDERKLIEIKYITKVYVSHCFWIFLQPDVKIPMCSLTDDFYFDKDAVI